ncbi:hypothetical protein ZHAS_00005517 [Anopheles sinensis]|uniref:Uncharacterized protein n=1 Tax=Anopheles sinensis TaxID=74873 RepID=A0A084VJR0_ANOSI|nr:hypothetical protein ZHAS_00005517 [Anopheles sinensis]
MRGRRHKKAGHEDPEIDQNQQEAVRRCNAVTRLMELHGRTKTGATGGMPDAEK